MSFYEEPNISEENPKETVYHFGNGFYNPYVEPAWKKEGRLIRNAANGIGLAALGYVVILLLSGKFYDFLMGVLFPSANIHGMLYVTEAAEWIFDIVTYVISIVVPFGIYMLCMRMPLSVALPFKKPKTDMAIGGILISLGMSILASYAVSFIQIALGEVGIGITMNEYETPETVPGLVLYVIFLAIIPAFFEEIAFRGILMQSLRRFGDGFALVVSALAFGIFHFNLIQMPYSFIMALCMGYFVMRTGSLWVTIIIHLINNGVAVVFEFLYPHLTEKAAYLTDAIYALISVALSVIGIVFLLSRYKDMFRFEPGRTVLSPEKRTIYFITAPVLIAAMIVSVMLTLPNIYII